MRPLVRLLAATASLAFLPGRLQAQAVNYSALQDTLGEPVTTSVTGKPQRASLAPASLVVITRDQIARSPARSVPDLLKVFAGVDVNRWTAGQSDIAVRGGVQPYNARLLVLVNGRQVYLDHYGMTDWNLLGVPLDAIQQIELVRGPASALFGFNAASGVVNIITVDPLQERQLAATVEGGTHGYSRLSGVVAAPIGEHVAVKLSGGHQREDERRVPDVIGVPASIPPVTADEVSGTVIVAPDPATRVELKGGFADNRQLEFLPSEILTEQHFRNTTAGALLDHDTGWGSVTAHGYVNWLDADYGITGAPPGPFSQLADIKLHNRTIVTKASTLVRVTSANTLRLGAEYRNNQLFSATQYSDRIGYQVVAADAMLDLHPVDRVGVSLAGRVDHLWLAQGGTLVSPVIEAPSAYDRSITRFSFNAALLLQTGDGGQLRINGGRGLQSPSLVNFGLRTQLPAAASPVPIYATGDPRIEPATVWSGELGYTQRLASGLRLEGTFFFTRTEDVISSPGDAPTYSYVYVPTFGLVTKFANVGSFDTYGVSVSANGRIAGAVGWQANYTWTHVHTALPDTGPPFAIAFAPGATTPKHVANVVLDYGGSRWFGNLAGRYTSATRQFAFSRYAQLLLFPVAQAFALDAKLGYRLTKRISAYGAGENLTDAGGAAGSPIPADRRLRLGLSFAL
jgi:iron complex outermembrane receptor protein